MNTTTTISNYDDVIDSRDVIARIEELTDEVSTCPHCGEGISDTDTECPDCGQVIDLDDERDELKALQSLAEEAEGYCEDWNYGAGLIRESYFTEYCMELLSDIGDLPHEIPHYIVIDEDATAENLKADYTEVDFDGVTYYIR